MYVIGYVIVHELAHLMKVNHTPRFWNIVRVKAPYSEKPRHGSKSTGRSWRRCERDAATLLRHEQSGMAGGCLVSNR